MIRQLEVSREEYNLIFQTQLENNAEFKEHSFGGRKKLYKNDTLIATYCPQNSIDLGVLDNKVFYRFLAQFNKQFYRQLINNQSLIELKISFDGYARGKRIENWDKITINNYFYCIDIKNAYWQIAHKLGYINDTFYNKYLHNEDFKQAKRFCISFLGRNNKTKYISSKDGSQNTITCNMELFNGAYTNIRNYLYNLIYICATKTEDKYLEYNIDAIFVLNTEVKMVKDILRSYGIISHLIECKKVSETQYLYKNKLRNFKR